MEDDIRIGSMMINKTGSYFVFYSHFVIFAR